MSPSAGHATTTPRVGFDARLWHHTGIGRYAANLLDGLAGPGWVVWVAPGDLDAARAAWPGARIRVCPAPVFSLAEQAFWHRELRRVPLDLFHAPHLNVPLSCPVPLVVTLHDLIPLRFPGTIRHPLGRLYFRVMAGLAVRRASRVIAVSRHTAGDLQALLGADPARVSVVGEAADPRFGVPVPPERLRALRERLGLTGRYVLYAGQWKAYKNLGTLIAAFAGLPDPGVSLVLAGRVDPREGHVGEAIARHALGNRVVTTGYLDELDLVALYQGASAFAFPSRYEGFGLPPLEAMAAGVPVVSSDAASLPEVVGDAALVRSPDDVAGWTAALALALDDAATRDRLVEAGRGRVTELSWAETARLTRAVYEAALTGG